jgi:hypothetical protein
MAEESGIRSLAGGRLGGHSLLSKWKGGGGVKRPRRDAHHSPSSSAEIKIVWSCTSTFPYVFWRLYYMCNFVTLSVARLYRRAGWLTNLKGFRRKRPWLIPATLSESAQKDSGKPRKTGGQPVSWPKFELRVSRIQAYSITAMPACSVCMSDFKRWCLCEISSPHGGDYEEQPHYLLKCTCYLAEVHRRFGGTYYLHLQVED